MAKKLLHLVIALTCLYQVNTQLPPESPCPRLFAYEMIRNPEPNRWYGIITLLSDIDLNGVWLRVMFDRPVLELGNWFGEVKPRGELNTDFLVTNRSIHITALVPQTVRIYVKYDPNNPVPGFKGFRLNARTMCPEGLDDATTTKLELQTSNQVESVTKPNPVIPNQPAGNIAQVNGQDSPCPRLFSYEIQKQPEPGRWYGFLTLLSDIDLNGVWLRVMFDRPILELGNWFGEVQPRDEINTDYLVTNRSVHITALVPETIRIYVKYDPNGPVPRLKGFRLNARTLCPEGLEESTTPKLELQTSNVVAETVTKPSVPSSQNNPPTNTMTGLNTQQSGAPESPCPRLFTYETSRNPEPGKWFGLLTLLSDIDLNGVWLRVMFDKPVLELGNWFGEVEPRDEMNTDFLVKNRSVHIGALVPQTIRIYAKYDPNGPVPKLKGFRLNARTLCPEGLDEATTPKLELQTSNVVAETVTKPSVPSSQNNPPTNTNTGLNTQQSGAPESPCPRLFTYETSRHPEPGKWFGLLTLLSDIDLNGVWLRVMFDKPVLELGNWFGEVKPRDELNTDFLVTNRSVHITALVPETIRIYAKYDPNGPVPRLKGFRLNARTLCPEGLEESTTPKLELQTSNVVAETVTKPSVPSSQNKPPTNTMTGLNTQQSGAPESPCPRLFTYETSRNPEPGKWFGLLTLLSDIDLNGVYLRVMFDKPVLELGNWFGEVDSRDEINTDFLVKNRSVHIAALVPQTIRIYAKYDPNGPVPKLKGFRLNARTLCPEGLDVGTTPKLELQTSNVVAETVTKPSVPSSQNNPTTNTMTGINTQQSGAPESPCPRLFTYETSRHPEPGKWFGLLTLLSDIDLNGVWLRVMFDKPVLELGNWFGEVKPRDEMNTDFLVTNRSVHITALVPETIRIYAKYDPNGPVPRLKGFRLNARTLCPEGLDEATTPKLELQTSNVVAETVTKPSVPSSQNNQPTNTMTGINTQQSGALESPCPRLFAYETNRKTEPGKWFGLLTLLSDIDLNGVYLRVMFDKPVLELGNWFGEVDSRDEINTDFLVKNRSVHITALVPQTIRIYAKYDPNGPVPKLKGFRLNARTLCPEGLDEATTPKLELQTSNVVDETVTKPSVSSEAGAKPVRPSTGNVNQVDTQAPESPCPRLFSYESSRHPEPGKWYGLLTLLSDIDLNGVWLRIMLDKPALELGNWFGEVANRDKNADFLIKNPKVHIQAYVPQTIRFYVKFNPNEQPPRLKGFRLNARPQCPEGLDTTTETLELQTSNEVLKPNGEETSANSVFPDETKPALLDNGNTTSGIIPSPGAADDDDGYFPGDQSFITGAHQKPFGIADLNKICGTTVPSKSPKAHSQATAEGEFPWHAAIYRSKGINLVYWCGGTLISKQHIVTVAHCVTKWKTHVPQDTDSFSIYLGKYYQNRFTSNMQERIVSEIIPHPKYDPKILCNDIAILKLATPVQITDYVRPVCLWQDSIDLNSAVNQEGSVVGWGIDQQGRLTQELTRAIMPIPTLETCYYALPNFFPLFASDTVYCASFMPGTSVCNGDSGGGMVIPKQISKQKTVWHLRGLVSFSVDLNNRFKCDASHYNVFTDTAKYLDWIKELIQK